MIVREYEFLTLKTRRDIDVTIVSGIHSTVASIGAILVLLIGGEDFGPESHLYAWSTGSMTLLCFSQAFFVWDIVVCWRDAYDTSFKVHAVCCATVYTLGLVPTPFCHWHAAYFLLNELSSPILAVRTILKHLGKTDTLEFRIVNFSFLVIFSVVRVFCSWPKVTHLAKLTFSSPDIRGLPIAIITIAMWILNVVWMCALIGSNVRRRNTIK